VAGSSSIYCFVTKKKIFCETRVQLYETSGSKPLIATVERIARFRARPAKSAEHAITLNDMDA
jgi:hypothetical protein